MEVRHARINRDTPARDGAVTDRAILGQIINMMEANSGQ